MRTTWAPDPRIVPRYLVASALLLAAASLACRGSETGTTATTQAVPYAFNRVAFTASGDPDVRTAAVGAIELRLSHPDAADNPTIWEGPLELRRSPDGAWCSAAPSLIVDVHLDTPGATALVRSYSGSRTFIDFVDVATCAPKWPQLQAVTDSVAVSGDRISISAACEGDATRSRCHAAQVLALHADAPPTSLEAESRALTRTQVGVEFTGQAWVAAARTPTARLLDR